MTKSKTKFEYYVYLKETLPGLIHKVFHVNHCENLGYIDYLPNRSNKPYRFCILNKRGKSLKNGFKNTFEQAKNAIVDGCMQNPKNQQGED